MSGPGCLRRCGCSWYRRARLNFDRRVACLDGPGRCVCWSAVARPRDRHTRASLGVVDLEARPGPAAAHRHRALALPPPTGTAARSSGPSGALHTVGACVASKPGQAPPPPTGTAARFSGLSGALHTSGARFAEDDSPRLEARPGPATADQHRGLAPPPPTGTLAGPTAPLAPRPGPPFPPTLSCGVRVLDRKFCCG